MGDDPQDIQSGWRTVTAVVQALGSLPGSQRVYRRPLVARAAMEALVRTDRHRLHLKLGEPIVQAYTVTS